MWKAFRRFLLDFSSLDRAEVPSLIIWEHHLVYAVSLGVAKQVLSQLKVVYPEMDQMGQPGHTGFGIGLLWAHVAGSGAHGAAFDAIGSLTEAIHSSVSAALNYHPSSGSGGGGGGGRAG